MDDSRFWFLTAYVKWTWQWQIDINLFDISVYSQEFEIFHGNLIIFFIQITIKYRKCNVEETNKI